MKKRLFMCFLSVCLAVGLMPITANGDPDQTPATESTITQEETTIADSTQSGTDIVSPTTPDSDTTTGGDVTTTNNGNIGGTDPVTVGTTNSDTPGTNNSSSTTTETDTTSQDPSTPSDLVPVTDTTDETPTETAETPTSTIPDGAICFDISAGSVTINSSTYTGYIFTSDGSSTKKITGKHNSENTYYIYQSNFSASQETAYDDYGTAQTVTYGIPTYDENGNVIAAPTYGEVHYNNQSWSEYITNNSSVEDVMDAWKTAIEGTGRAGVDDSKITITTSKATDEFNVIIDNLYMTYDPSSPSDGPIKVTATNGGTVNLQTKGDSRIRNIYYVNTSDTNGGKLNITSHQGEGSTEGSLTVCDLQNLSENTRNSTDCLAIIGSANKNVYGLKFSGGTIYAGFPAQNNKVWNDRNNVTFRTCIGGGNNYKGEVTITGGNITAVSNGTSPAIGGGSGYRLVGGTGKVDISGTAKVYAYASGIYSIQSGKIGYVPTTAIGGASTFDQAANGTLNDTNDSPSEITISGNAYVYAESLGGTAIGGGNSRNNKGGDAIIKISGNAKVEAVSKSGNVYTSQDGSSEEHVNSSTSIGGGSGTTGGNAQIYISDQAQVWASGIGGGSAVNSAKSKGTEDAGNGGDGEIWITGSSSQMYYPMIKAGTIGGGTTENTETGHIGFARAHITYENKIFGILTPSPYIAAQFLLRGTLDDNATAEEIDNKQCIFEMTCGCIVADNNNTLSVFSSENCKDEYFSVRKTDGGAVWMDDQYGQVTMSGGSVNNRSANNGGAMYMTAGTFTMTGGMINSCTAANNGGAVYMDGGTVNISGNAKITNCKAEGTSYVENDASPTAQGCGGAVYMEDGKINMTGGTVSGCTAGSESHTTHANIEGCGGALYMANGDFEFIGGKISGCKALTSSADPDSAENTFDTKGCGGGTYIGGGTVNMDNNATITDCTATHSGGGGAVVWTENAITSQEEGVTTEVENPSSDASFATQSSDTEQGSGSQADSDAIVETEAKSEFAVVFQGSGSNKPSITSCTATLGNGGGLYVKNGSFKIDDGSVENCTAVNYDTLNSAHHGNGGGICIMDGRAYILEGTVSGCSASRFGGGIYVNESDTFTDDMKKIEEAAAEDDGEGSTSYEIVLAGGQVSGCKAGQSGGGLAAIKADIYTGDDPNIVQTEDEAAGSTEKTYTSVINNEAVNGGGLYVRYGCMLKVIDASIDYNKAVSLQGKESDSFYGKIAKAFGDGTTNNKTS